MLKILPANRLQNAMCVGMLSAILIFSFAFGIFVPTAAHGASTQLKGPQLQKLFDEFEDVEFPSDGTGSETDNWLASFTSNGTWEAATGGSDADGTWRVEGDALCTKISNNVTSSAAEENIVFEGCFSVFVDSDSGAISGNFPSIGEKGFVLKEVGFGDIARSGKLETAPNVAAKTAPQPSKDEIAAREEEARQRAQHEQEAQARQRELDAAKEREAENERQAALAREAEEQRAAANTASAKDEQSQLEQQRLATEAKLKQLRLELELERLRQKRTAQQAKSSDNIPPVIQAAKALETRSSSVTVEGVATDNVSLVRVELNGKRLDLRNGRFSTQTRVKLGRNDLLITAFDAQGNKSEHAISVIRQRDIPEIAYGDYHALVIGINDYKSLPKLNTAVQDAETVAKTLESLYGYEVTLLTNPSRFDIIDAFDDLRDDLSEEDNLLIYYAGHGWLDQQTKTGYWLPVNAKADRRSRWISNATLTNALQSILAKHVMVVADSCYSGTLTRSIKVPERNRAYLERMAEKRARVVLASGGLEPVADSGGGKHSVFAAQFLKALQTNEGVLDGTKLFEKVRQNVVLNADQTPEYSDIRKAGHEGGDFLFVRKN